MVESERLPNILWLALDSVILYPSGVSPLERFAALTPRHDALAEVVRELENLWGDGPTLAEVARVTGLRVGLVRKSLIELDGAGVIIWCELTATACCLPTVPILGDVS